MMSWLSPAFAVCRPLRISILTGGIWFLDIVLIVIPPVIITMLNILFCGYLGFFSFLFHKGFEEIYMSQLTSWKLNVFGNFSAVPTIGHFLRAALIKSPSILWTGLAVKHCWSSCIYRKCPQDSSISSCPTVVPGAERSLWKTSFLGCEL